MTVAIEDRIEQLEAEVSEAAANESREYRELLCSLVEAGSDGDVDDGVGVIQEAAQQFGKALKQMASGLRIARTRFNFAKGFDEADAADAERQQAEDRLKKLNEEYYRWMKGVDEKREEFKRQSVELNNSVQRLMNAAMAKREFAKQSLLQLAPPKYMRPPLVGDIAAWREFWREFDDAECNVSEKPVVIKGREYGEHHRAAVRTWIVIFSGNNPASPDLDLDFIAGRVRSGDANDYPQPVEVVAIDEADAWSQVVQHYHLDASRYKAKVIRKS